MIFVTVGSDTPFDRLIRAVDQWAAERNRTDVFAQIGRGEKPQFIQFSAMLEPAEFKKCLSGSDIVVAHAGMGTILTALQSLKPILVMPRRGALGETRNDHQLATSKQLLAMGKINVAFDEVELVSCLDRLDKFMPKEPISPYASSDLISGLRRFIHQQNYK